MDWLFTLQLLFALLAAAFGLASIPSLLSSQGRQEHFVCHATVGGSTLFLYCLFGVVCTGCLVFGWYVHDFNTFAAVVFAAVLGLIATLIGLKLKPQKS